MKVKEYFSRFTGKSPYKKWFKRLDLKVQAKIYARYERIEDFGHLGDHKRFGGLIELRWRNGTRVYCCEHGGDIIFLLGGGDKDSQSKDIEKAKELLKELKNEKK